MNGRNSDSLKNNIETSSVSPGLDSAFTLILLISASLLWWGLAFYPSTQLNQEWLAAVRLVCFGMLDDGLPDTAGWILLILSPLLMFVAYLFIWPGAVSYWFNRIWRKPYFIGKAFLVVLSLTVLMQMMWTRNALVLARELNRFSASSDETRRESLAPDYPRTQKNLLPFDLVDQFGNKVTHEGLSGKAVVLTFAFAHCTTICPTLVHDSLKSIEGLNQDQVEVLIVTLDPWRDTPRSLPTLAESWKLPTNARVLSGSVESVTKMLKDYQVPFARNEKTGDVSHPSLVYIIDPDSKLAYTFNNAPTHWLRTAVERVL